MVAAELLGYRRQHGRVEVRNGFAILPVDDISNGAAEAVAAHIKGHARAPALAVRSRLPSAPNRLIYR